MADITFTGNLGGDPELRFQPSGKAVLSLSVAESHSKRNPGGGWDDDGTTWWRVTVWERAAETLADVLRKGDRVLVVGSVRSREWEDRDGQKRTAYDVRARAVAVVPKPGAGTRPAQQRTGSWTADLAQQRPADDPWATTESAPF